jgi:hypothetical protein
MSLERKILRLMVDYRDTARMCARYAQMRKANGISKPCEAGVEMALTFNWVADEITRLVARDRSRKREAIWGSHTLGKSNNN